ncbi:hypothetical protein [Mastigocladopsis repens]|uniref:hypothetical protein n=1 Tax=Mastigocladopsis repens TaxID=221287 RepID=UPI000308E5EE|nr:hypothetical protein [Mastigocladopsis repens]
MHLCVFFWYRNHRKGGDWAKPSALKGDAPAGSRARRDGAEHPPKGDRLSDIIKKQPDVTY